MKMCVGEGVLLQWCTHACTLRRTCFIISLPSLYSNSPLPRPLSHFPLRSPFRSLCTPPTRHTTGFQKQYGHRDEVTKFLECSTLLCGLDHPNLHSVLRVSVEDNYIPVVVYPSMEYGNLHQFLSLCRINPLDSPLNVRGEREGREREKEGGGERERREGREKRRKGRGGRGKDAIGRGIGED